MQAVRPADRCRQLLPLRLLQAVASRWPRCPAKYLGALDVDCWKNQALGLLTLPSVAARSAAATAASNASVECASQAAGAECGGSGVRQLQALTRWELLR